MTYLRLLAPVTVDYRCVPGAVERDPAAYAAFWERVRRALPTLPEIAPGAMSVRLEHDGVAGVSSRYAALDVDALDRPLHVLTVSLPPDALAADADAALLGTVLDVTFRVYDHGIGVLEIGVDLPPLPVRGRSERLDEVQSAGVRLAERVGAEVARKRLSGLLALIHRLDRRECIVRAAREDDAQAFGRTLWVSRALVVTPRERAALAHWTKDVVGGDDEAMRTELLEGTRDSLVRWLNYGFVDRRTTEAFGAGGAFADQWRALGYAQAVYASLDVVDSELSVVLAQAAAATSRWELEQLRGTLVELSNRAELVIMQRQHLVKYMNRHVRACFEDILEAWQFAALIEDPVRFKIEACARRLDDLAARRTARSGMVTDLILLGIGVTSIASTALAVLEFGRQSATEPGSAGYDLGASEFTRWFAAQPIDVVLMISAATSAVLVVLYLYFRRDDR